MEKKQYYKAMEPAEKKNINGEKAIQGYEKKTGDTEKTVPKIQNSGYWVISIFGMHQP